MIGFKVHFSDGSTFDESQGYWDDVPRDRVVTKLAVVDLETGAEHLTVTGKQQYFFANEGMSGGSGAHVHIGKIVGGIKDGQAEETRWEVFPDPGADPTQTYPAEQCPYSSEGFRAGE